MATYDTHHPWIVFNLDSEEYCVNSAFVDSIVLPMEITKMPNNPAHLLGVMKLANKNIPVVDMRTLLGMLTMEEAVRDFAVMRRMHLEWVEALDDSVHNRVPFTKAVNPHKCKFGLWYDNYHTDNVHLKFILNKIDEPHSFIHLCGAEAQKLMAQGDWEGAEEKYKEAKDVCYNTVVPLLDELIEAYRDVNRGNIIVLRDGKNKMGLLVDEIARLVPGAKTDTQPVPAGVGRSEFVKDIVIDGEHALANVDVDTLWMFMASHAKDVNSALEMAAEQS